MKLSANSFSLEESEISRLGKGKNRLNQQVNRSFRYSEIDPSQIFSPGQPTYTGQLGSLLFTDASSPLLTEYG